MTMVILKKIIAVMTILLMKNRIVDGEDSDVLRVVLYLDSEAKSKTVCITWTGIKAILKKLHLLHRKDYRQAVNCMS